MTQAKKLISVLGIFLFILSGCVRNAEPKYTFPGTWTVPEGWVELKDHSTAKKIFYVEEGHESGETTPDNISIEVGTNRYAEEEHMRFRDAIVRQLLAQLKDTDAQLTGDGSFTEQGYVLYTFTVDDAEKNIVTKQFYIVGDKRYCLIHLTNFTGSESANDAAQAMVDSFVWSE